MSLVLIVNTSDILKFGYLITVFKKLNGGEISERLDLIFQNIVLNDLFPF